MGLAWTDEFGKRTVQNYGKIRTDNFDKPKLKISKKSESNCRQTNRTKMLVQARTHSQKLTVIQGLKSFKKNGKKLFRFRFSKKKKKI